MAYFLTLLGMFVSVLLILVILLQRGRGGGLVGALSGLGGQSAFGTKAGDTFTRITIGIAAVWVVLAGISGQVLRKGTVKLRGDVETLPSKDTGLDVKPKPGTAKDAAKDSRDAKEADEKDDVSKKATKPEGDSATEKSAESSKSGAATKPADKTKSGGAASEEKNTPKKDVDAEPDETTEKKDSADKPSKLK